MAVEHDKGVVMLERTPRPRRGSGHRNVERLFRELFNDPDGRQLRDDFSCHLDLEQYVIAL
jgi:hypothetical protein